MRGESQAERQKKSAAVSAALPFRAGQTVLCVDDSGTRLVTRGKPYRVAQVDRHMLIIEQVNPGLGINQHMLASRFSPMRVRK